MALFILLKHALSRKNLKNSLKTMEKLKKQIIIPIFIKKLSLTTNYWPRV